MAESRKRLVIIDGKSVFYRGYYAMPYLKTREGISTGGVYGFAVMALEVIRKLAPDYVCVAWDKPKTNIRKRLALYNQYKAGRKPAPADFYEQVPLLHELLKAFGWPLYELDDYEADDIMGTLADQAKKQNVETLLVTSDMDVLQLVNSHTHAYLLKKGLSSIEEYDPNSFEAKYHIEAEQFLDYKALAGDSSDNIPGVPGIGPKTAIELLQEYHDIDKIFENLDLVKNTLKVKLEKGKELGYLSKQLAEIWLDAPIKLDLKSMNGSGANPAAIAELLHKFEFRSLVNKLPEIMQEGSQKTMSTAKLNLPEQIIIDNDESLSKLDFQDSKELILYSRSAGKHGQRPVLLMISPVSDKLVTLKLESLTPKSVKAKLGPVFASQQINKVGYDIKATIKLGYALDIELEKIGHDIQVAAFILDPLLRDLSLTSIAEVYAGYSGSSLENLDNDELLAQAPAIISAIRASYHKQHEALTKVPKLLSLTEDIEWPVIPVLARMEVIGIKLDTDYLSDVSVRVDHQIKELEGQIYKYAGEEFNINSPAQLSTILFEKLKLPVVGIKKTKTKLSTASKELEKLAGTHPVVDLIQQYRELAKLKNTYIDTLPKLIDQNSRLHTTYNLTTTQTGRLSSTDPNLQNIPVRTQVGRQIRTAFIAGPGNLLVSADYSQFELRLAAYLAGDKELIDEFNKDVDIHAMIAAQVYGRDPEDVTKEMRRSAKAINFGILYGMSPHGLSVATNMTQAAAKAFIDKYYELRRPLINYLDKLKAFARKEGYVEDLFGRRRPIPDINSKNYILRQAAERAAINMPIQATEADLMKLSMVAVDKLLKDSDCKILLQIHDSIVVECPSSKAKKVAGVLKGTMEGIYTLPVKLTVDTTIGDNWGQL